MLQLGEINILTILRGTSVGMYLGDEEGNDVLLPNKYVPENATIGETIEVFLYRDSEDRIIATTLQPKIRLNEFAYLQVNAVNNIGAFVDWGLEKDLLIPFREQNNNRLREGDQTIVYLYLDESTDRLVGSCKISKFIEKETKELSRGQEVDLLVYAETNLGMNAIINNKFQGLIFGNEIFRRVKLGTKTKGYIKNIRPDNLIDLSLEKLGYDSIEDNAIKILQALEKNEGFLDLTDQSEPNYIMYRLEMSKKTYKKAVGLLYKQKKVLLKEDGIYLIQK